ncbi:hypothetical protein QTO34_001335 [Cnephaeus nilssonii]|uniref:LRRNT domain-containing protein n=1 Tax=Cnephaeus nilssonii TaxID=3371016 RepID=A0AA40LLM1_CNENI|nr:hypothetical protein QTO34_001335 [Eptesicus nilssonii]
MSSYVAESTRLVMTQENGFWNRGLMFGDHLQSRMALKCHSSKAGNSDVPKRNCRVLPLGEKAFGCGRCAFSAPFSTLLLLHAALSRLNLPRYCPGYPNLGEFHEIRSRFCSSPSQGLQRVAARREESPHRPGPPPPPGLVFPSGGGWARGWGASGSRHSQLGARKSPRLRWDTELPRELAGAEVLQRIRREAPTQEARGATQGRRREEERALGVRTAERKVFSRSSLRTRALGGGPAFEPSERAPSQASSGDTRAVMPGGCARGPAAAGDAWLRLARLALVLLGWVSSSSLPSSATSSASSAPFAAASAQPPLPGQCPPPCECSEAARTVKCVNRNLTEVPADLPPYVRTLFLTGNQLAVLPAGAFSRLPPLAELAALNLSGSRLEEVRAGAFEHLPSLRQLDLSHNPLASLSPFAFSGINASVSPPSPLAELFLNRIVPPDDDERHTNRSFEAMVAAALRAGQALRGLRRLELTSNCLVYLPQDVLAQLPSLRHLDLRNNSLVSLTYLSFRNLTHLESLHLEDNALKALHNGTLAEWQGLPQSGSSWTTIPGSATATWWTWWPGSRRQRSCREKPGSPVRSRKK